MSQRKAKPPRFGATGKFPQGRVHTSDEGELQFGIATDREHGVVVLNFGNPVAWLGLPPAHARQIAAALIKHAEELEALPPVRVPS
jgi:hypothetical protein